MYLKIIDDVYESEWGNQDTEQTGSRKYDESWVVLAYTIIKSDPKGSLDVHYRFGSELPPKEATFYEMNPSLLKIKHKSTIGWSQPFLAL